MQAEAETKKAEDLPCNPGAPNLWDVDQYLLYLPILIHLNHPQTIPSHPWFVEKLSSMKLVSGNKMPGDCSVI